MIEAFRQPAIKQPYVMRSLAMPTYDVTKFQKSDEQVNHSFWWEVLCVVRSRPPGIVEKTIEVLGKPSLKVRMRKIKIIMEGIDYLMMNACFIAEQRC